MKKKQNYLRNEKKIQRIYLRVLSPTTKTESKPVESGEEKNLGKQEHIETPDQYWLKLGKVWKDCKIEKIVSTDFTVSKFKKSKVDAELRNRVLDEEKKLWS